MWILALLQLAATDVAVASMPLETSPVIVVTALRIETPVDQVAGSIEVIAPERLARAGVFAASDIASLSASVTQTSIFGSSAPQFTLRGVGSNDVNPSANPGVSIYLNDTLVSSPLGQNLTAFDLSAVEILKGPQGTLFGRNSTGGTIILRTRRPAAEAGGKIALSGGSFGFRGAEFGLDSGQVGPARARFAGVTRVSNGWTSNTLTDTHENGLDTYAVRATIEADLSPRWNASLMVDWAADRSGMTGHEGRGLIDPQSSVGAPCSTDRVLADQCINLIGYRYSPDPYSEGFDRASREYLDTGGASLSLARDGAVGFRSSTSWRTAQREVREDTDASPVDLVALDFVNDSQMLTQEFLLHGTAGNADWRAGAFYLDEHLDTDNRFATLGVLRSLGVPFIPDPALFFQGPFRLHQSYALKTRSAAVFADADFHLSERLTASAGVRLTRETTRFSTQTMFDEAIPNPVLSPQRSARVTDDATSWRVAGRYDAGVGRTLYASVSRGFKSSGFNGGALFATDEIGPLAPEFVLATEVGTRWRFTDRLSGAGSIFTNDYSDLQVFTLRALPLPTRQILDSGDARMSGADLSLAAFLPAGFSTDLGFSYLDAKFTRFVDANGDDRSGLRVPSAPEFSGIATLDWSGDLGNAIEAEASVSARYRSAIFFDSTNSALLRSGPSTQIGAALTLRDAITGWQVELAGTNLADEEQVAAALVIAEYGFLQQTYAPPRSLYLTVSQSF